MTNKLEQLKFFKSEVLGELGWNDEAEQTGIDPLDFFRLKVNEIRQQKVWWKESYYLIADAVARENNGPVQLADIARQTRVERDLLLEKLKEVSQPVTCPECGEEYDGSCGKCAIGHEYG